MLEPVCGTERLTLPLARDGHEVVGLDASDAMLAMATRKAARDGTRFVRDDLRAFDLERRFGLVIISCNLLAHVTDVLEFRCCLAAARRHLGPGGALAFDVVLPGAGLLARSEGDVRRLDLGPNPASAVLAEEVARHGPLMQLRVAHWRVREPSGSGPWRPWCCGSSSCRDCRSSRRPWA